MRQITDEMVRTVMKGGGLNCEGFLMNLIWNPSPTLHAISSNGLTILNQKVMVVSHGQIKTAIGKILQDINSSTHLPASAYNNGIRLDTEHRCQNQRCNPAGKRRLLFVSAGTIAQILNPGGAMQVKCKCGWINTFWNNRIDFDEYGALFMKKNGSGK